MLFPTVEFAVFFGVVLAVVAVVDRRMTARKGVLLAASYGFYMWWNPAFVLLIVASTAIDFAVGRRIERAAGATRTRWLAVSIAANLGVLGLFKYGGFFQENLLWALRLAGQEPGWTTLHLVLPVGISFYTFQTLSYAIDVYRGVLPASRRPLDFALFVAFFPQLVAGPIVRASAFLPQLERPAGLRFRREAFFLFLRGLAKKVLVADNVAVLVAVVYADPAAQGSGAIWLAAACFYVQIYCDFSGYSDMAIALGDVLGFDLPDNFDRPYFARSPTAFWRRWHITLSTWLRDYLYIPLGGSRGGRLAQAGAVMGTMLLGGLWHGASWNFVIWGALHGLALLAHRTWVGWRKQRLPGLASSAPYQAASWALLQGWVMVTWIPFRIAEPGPMLHALRKFMAADGSLYTASRGLGSASPAMAALIVLAFWAVHWHSARRGGWDVRLARAPLAVAAAACVAAGALFALFWPMIEAPFIYFQF